MGYAATILVLVLLAARFGAFSGIAPLFRDIRESTPRNRAEGKRQLDALMREVERVQQQRAADAARLSTTSDYHVVTSEMAELCKRTSADQESVGVGSERPTANDGAEAAPSAEVPDRDVATTDEAAREAVALAEAGLRAAIETLAAAVATTNASNEQAQTEATTRIEHPEIERHTP